MTNTPCVNFKEVAKPVDEALDMLKNDGAFHCALGHKLKDEFDFAFACCCNDGRTDLCADFQAVISAEMRQELDRIEAYFDEAVLGHFEAYKGAMNGFDLLVQLFNTTGEVEYLKEIIKLKNKGGAESFRMGINALYGKIDSAKPAFRSYQNGKSVV